MDQFSFLIQSIGSDMTATKMHMPSSTEEGGDQLQSDR